MVASIRWGHRWVFAGEQHHDANVLMVWNAQVAGLMALLPVSYGLPCRSWTSGAAVVANRLRPQVLVQRADLVERRLLGRVVELDMLMSVGSIAYLSQYRVTVIASLGRRYSDTRCRPRPGREAKGGLVP